MKIIKLFFFLMMICSSPSIYAQQPEEIQWKHLQKNYSADSTKLVLSLNGKPLQGKYKIPLDNNSFALYDINEGLISGEAFWYSISGNLECKLNYKNGVRNGLKENYDSEGVLWLRQEYKDGRQNGANEMYSGGKITSKTNYREGKMDGLSVRYANDQVITETNYKGGLRNGLSRSYHNGLIMSENNYLDDLQDGLCTTYNMGKKNMDATYQKGQKNGVAHMYKPDGTVLFESYFVLGLKVSKAEYEKYLNN
jgi:antitoxin component YwqK of YwqJK toxin-antitoxin module